jgi:hypothetical protein
MGQADAARVDVPALMGVAQQYELIADIVDAAVRTHLDSLTFDGADAGREYVAQGDVVHTSVQRVVNRLREWSRASTEIAGALRSAADRYADADARAGERVR